MRAQLSEHDAKLIFENYIKERGYTSLRLPEDSINKKPDFEISSEHSTYVCEFKSPVLFLDDETNLYKFSTTNSKIRTFIHRAVKQFTAYDKAHAKPRILVLTSDHPQLNWNNFTNSIQGGVVHNNEFIADFTGSRVVRDTNKNLYEIDLYMWLQVSTDNKKIYQATYILNAQTQFRQEIGRIVGDFDKLKASPMDNIFQLD